MAVAVIDAAAALFQPQFRLESLELVRERSRDRRQVGGRQGGRGRGLRYGRASHVDVPRRVAPYAEVEPSRGARVVVGPHIPAIAFVGKDVNFATKSMRKS